MPPDEQEELVDFKLYNEEDVFSPDMLQLETYFRENQKAARLREHAAMNQ